MADPDIDDIKRRMEGAVSVLDEELGGLRTGRASASLLDRIVVKAYGSEMPLMLVNVWDRGNAQAVERAIRESDLGLNPATEGQVLRVPIPELSAERREEMVKIAHRYAEQARISVRNVRRDGMEKLKRMEKEGELSQDEHHAWGEEIQEMTNGYVKRIDETLAEKEAEIRQI
jgi:ribosome recycling factor